jgi:membrane AbrB-like protein
MLPSPEPSDPGPLTRLPGIVQWLLLAAGSAALIFLFLAIQVPAALLIGSMIVSILFGTLGATIRVPPKIFGAAQAVVGCLVATSIDLGIFSSFLHDWRIILLSVFATLAASSVLGWAISRLGILPGSTAIWGTAPGGSTAMVLMSAAFGADARLVAFMQYLRVVMVTVAAAFVASLWVDTSHVARPETVWFPPIAWPALAVTLVVAMVAGPLGKFLRLPSPWFLGSLALGMLLHLGAGVPMQVPEWLKALSYAVVGWAVGMNFTRAVVWHAVRVLPQVFAATLVLILFCGGIAWLLSHELGIDPLTAYLATSPGGLDSVAIIAAASDKVNLSFVMALQTARLLIVLMLGPALAKFIARKVRM